MAESDETTNGGPVALVTGGAVRVGEAIVRGLHGRGCRVMLTYHRSEMQAKALCAELSASGPEVVAVKADLREAGAGEAVIAEISKKWGRLDVLVNSAGVFPRGRLAETSAEMIAECMAVHVTGPVMLVRAGATMLKASRGVVINMTDIAAERPWPGYLAYSASKAALANATVSMARQLAPDVRVNAIAPGAVCLPEDYAAEEKAKTLARVPLKREGQASDVAKAVCYLVFDAPYVTGQTLKVDGGRSVV